MEAISRNEWQNWKGQTNGEDPEWVKKSYAFWSAQGNGRTAKWNRDMLKMLAAKLGIEL